MDSPRRTRNSVLLGDNFLENRKPSLLSPTIRRLDRILLFITIFVLAFAYSLDGSMRPNAYQAVATASFSQHPFTGSISTIVGVTGAVVQPAIAQIAEAFGRPQLAIVAVFLYCTGTVVQATSIDVSAYAAGAVFYNIGYVSMILVVEVIISDLTSLRSRVFFSYIPTLPFLINAWLSGNVFAETLDGFDGTGGGIGWRWGVGMWGIIVPGCAVPFISIIYLAQQRVKKAIPPRSDAQHDTARGSPGIRRSLSIILWQLDLVGLVLLFLALGSILMPITIAQNGRHGWTHVSVWLPLVLGGLCIPAFIVWEAYAKHPMMPFKLLKDRGIWGALGIALIFNMAYSIQHEYLQTVLIIGFGESKRSAIRITNLYNFASVTTGALVGLTIYRVRHLQPFIMCGTALYFSALVLLCLFPGGQGKDAHYVVVFGQVLLGIGGGLFPFPTMASIQAATDHKYMAVITGLYFAVYRIGSAIGSCVAATIWLGVLPSRFRGRLSSNEALWAVNAPFTFTSDSNYSPEAKVAFLECYKDIQRILCIVAASVSALLIVFAFVIRNPKLGDEQSLPDPSSFELQDLPARHHDNRTENNLNVPDIYGGQRPPGTPRSAQTGSDPQLDISPEPHTPLGKH